MVLADTPNKFEPILIKSPGSFKLDSPESDKKIVNLQLILEDCFNTSKQLENSKINYNHVLKKINQKTLNSDKTPVISCKELITAYKNK